MSVAACQFCIWSKELLGLLLFLLKPWLSVHWPTGTWVPSFVYKFHVIWTLSLLLVLFVNLQLWVPCRTIRSLFWCAVGLPMLLLAQQEGHEWAPRGGQCQPKPACCWKLVELQPWQWKCAQSVGNRSWGCQIVSPPATVAYIGSVFEFLFFSSLFGTVFFWRDTQSLFCFCSSQ